jgi:hypothetical protein
MFETWSAGQEGARHMCGLGVLVDSNLLFKANIEAVWGIMGRT